VTSSTTPSLGRRPHCLTNQTWWPRHPFLQNVFSSRICGGLRGFRCQFGITAWPRHRHTQSHRTQASRSDKDASRPSGDYIDSIGRFPGNTYHKRATVGIPPAHRLRAAHCPHLRPSTHEHGWPPTLWPPNDVGLTGVAAQSQ
jgi:hypothetical protein